MNFLKIITVFSLIIVLTSCAQKDEMSSNNTCPINEYDNTKLSSGTLKYRAPGSWQRREVSNAMRSDELVIDQVNQASRFSRTYSVDNKQ